jgi:hypothetical protein
MARSYEHWLAQKVVTPVTPGIGGELGVPREVHVWPPSFDR